MCIRDSSGVVLDLEGVAQLSLELLCQPPAALKPIAWNDCLLYTSDAADERSSVDLGGRRIIKKKK